MPANVNNLRGFSWNYLKGKQLIFFLETGFCEAEKIKEINQ